MYTSGTKRSRFSKQQIENRSVRVHMDKEKKAAMCLGNSNASHSGRRCGQGDVAWEWMRQIMQGFAGKRKAFGLIVT